MLIESPSWLPRLPSLDVAAKRRPCYSASKSDQTSSIAAHSTFLVGVHIEPGDPRQRVPEQRRHDRHGELLGDPRREAPAQLMEMSLRLPGQGPRPVYDLRQPLGPVPLVLAGQQEWAGLFVRR